MAKETQEKYSAALAFKAQVALAAVQNQLTVAETLVERPTLTYTRSRVYRGPWELTPEGRLILHAPAGVYDVDSGRHYWHLNDRLGHVRAVVGENGAAVQATRYNSSKSTSCLLR